MIPSWFFLFLISAFLLAGCTSSGPTMQPTQGTQIPSPTISLATTTTIPTWTMTLAITDTETPMPTLTGTLTPTPVETMEPTQAMETIQPLLKNPMNCAVPCFWGMTPGKTTMDEVRAFFSRLGYIPYEGKDPNSGIHFYTIRFDPNSGLYGAIFFTTNSLIENIFLVPEITKQEGSPRDWIAFSPETLIKKFGGPSKVLLNFFRGQMASDSLTMVLYFDDLDLIAEYSGYNMVPRVPHSPVFCPLTASIDSIQIWMGPNPQDPPDTESIDPFAKLIPLEEATSITIDQFTQMMLGDPRQACFTINGDLFPN
jgi:hypothetical protein